MLAPLMVFSCFTVPTVPHDGHGGGGVDLIELSGIERAILTPLTRPLCRDGFLTRFLSRL